MSLYFDEDKKEQMKKECIINNKQFELFDNEIIFLFHLNEFNTEQKEFSKYWKERYGIDPKKTLEILEKNGFIIKSVIPDDLSWLTVSELEKILANNNLSPNGKKDELIETINDHLKNGDINLEYPQKYYRLTETGKNELKDKDYLNYLQKHDVLMQPPMAITKDELKKKIDILKQKDETFTYRDALWSLFNDKIDSTSDKSKLSIIYYFMADFLKEEDQCKKAIIFAFCANIMFYDNDYELRNIFNKPGQTVKVYLAPGQERMIWDCVKKENVSNDELYYLFHESIVIVDSRMSFEPELYWNVITESHNLSNQ